MNRPQTADVLVIGAGVIGCSIARELAERGAGKVVVIDRGLAGDGSSNRAAGGLREQFSTEINVRFSQLSMPVFRNARETLGGDISYKETGYLFLARSEDQAAAFKDNVSLQQHLGVLSQWLEVDRIAQMWPFLELEGVLAGSWCPTDALIDQVKYTDLLVARTRDAGVTIREGVSVNGLQVDGNRINGVDTSEGRLTAGVTVLAAGAWSPDISRTAGIELHISANRREIVTSSPVDGLPEDMPFIADFDVASYVRQDENGYRISGRLQKGTVTEDGPDASSRQDTLDWASTLVPALKSSTVTGGWSGLTEVSPDHHALIGEVEHRPGLVVATGFSGHGLMHAPATGVLVAELILDGAARTLDISKLSPMRFERGEGLAETMFARTHEQGDILSRPAAG